MIKQECIRMIRQIIVVYSSEVQAKNMWKIRKKEIEVNNNCQKIMR
jgi:hypothetical protein